MWHGITVKREVEIVVERALKVEKVEEGCQLMSGEGVLREASNAKKSQNCGLFPYGGGGGSTPFRSFWGYFP